jgi:hypothetical protein
MVFLVDCPPYENSRMGVAHACAFGNRCRARLDNTFLAVEQHILNQRSMRNTQWKAESVLFHMIPYLLALAKCKGVFEVLGDEILYVYTQYTYIIRIYGILRI